MPGCGKTTENSTTKAAAMTESKETESEETKSVKEPQEETEPVYTEYTSFYLLEGVDRTGTGYDMNSLKPDGKAYTLSKSVDIYYVNENKCVYTKENIDINVITSNDDYCYVILDHKDGFLLKTKEVEAASVEETEAAEGSLSEDKTQENSTNIIFQ